MADFNLPIVTSEFQNVWDYVKAVQTSLAVWQDGTTDTNIPVGSKRWSDSNRRFEEWDGTAWNELLPIADDAQPYQIRVAVANECSGNAATADLADNSSALGGVLAAEFVQTTDTRLSNSRQCNNAFDNAATARVNLSVNSAAEVSDALALKANLASPSFTGSPTCPSQPTGTDGNRSARLANTAFVYDSIQAFMHDALPSENGYIRFSDPSNSNVSGIIIQWGVCSGSEDAWAYRSYPMQFPNAALAIVGSKADSYSSTDTNISIDLYSNSLFRVCNNAYGDRNIRWVAIGY